MSFSIEFQVTKLQEEEEVKHQTFQPISHIMGHKKESRDHDKRRKCRR